MLVDAVSKVLSALYYHKVGCADNTDFKCRELCLPFVKNHWVEKEKSRVIGQQ